MVSCLIMGPLGVTGGPDYLQYPKRSRTLRTDHIEGYRHMYMYI